MKIENRSQIYIWDHSTNGSYIETFADSVGKKKYIRMEKGKKYEVVVGTTISLYTAIKIRILEQLESAVSLGQIDISYQYYLKVYPNL